MVKRKRKYQEMIDETKEEIPEEIPEEKEEKEDKCVFVMMSVMSVIWWN